MHGFSQIHVKDTFSGGLRMQINITFRHVESSPSLRSYAEEKISRVRKYLEEPIDAHIVLKVEKFRRIAEVTIEANGMRVNGSEETEDMYSAIDALADNMEDQVRKLKEKQQRRKAVGSKSLGNPTDEDGFTVADKGEPRVIKTDQVPAKPMDLDEAVMQLGMSKLEFLVFTNRNSNRVNVLYRRKDGHFGLVETV
jgi:putative sigma-54 modulation protein